MSQYKLFCIPYAGGTAKYFSGLKDAFQETNVEVIPLEYAGHGRRGREVKCDNFDQLARDVYAQICDNCKLGNDAKIILFGYSMGALVVYDIVTRLMDETMRNRVEHIFLAAHEPPDILFRGNDFAKFSDEEFLEEMIKLGGIDERLLNNPRFLKPYLTLIRSDYELLASYEWNGIFEDFGVDLTIFYTEEDTPFENISHWGKYNSKEICFYNFAGGHFFLKEKQEEIADIIRLQIIK